MGWSLCQSGRRRFELPLLLSSHLESYVYLNRYEGLPIPFLIMLAVVALFGFIAEKTTYGRSVYAIGGSMEAADIRESR